MAKAFKAIAAMSLNRVIGRENKLPWHIPDELKWFKKMTTGHVIVMGRGTWESIGRALPNRETVVVSRKGLEIPGVRVVRSLDELDPANDPREYFLVGGAQLFEAGLARCSELYLTVVKREVEGDVWFPPFEKDFELLGVIEEKPEFKILHYQKKGDGLKIEYLPGPIEIAGAAARKLVEAVRGSNRSEPFGIALSGGRIAKSFFEEIVKKGAEVPFGNVHFFWADERCVPATDPESSYAIARDHLFVPLRIPSENIHRIIGEAEPAFAAEQAEAELCRIMPLTGDGEPILDVVILGMGEDGHVASLFPEESEAERQNPAVYRLVVATKPPPNRITIGYAAIAAAKAVWVLASGQGKRAAYEGLLKKESKLPIVQVVNARPETLILQDIAPMAEKN